MWTKRDFKAVGLVTVIGIMIAIGIVIRTEPVQNYTVEQELQLQDQQLLGLLIWGEARGESDEGKLAVGWVVRNRLNAKRDYGVTWREVMLKDKQFSCFNDENINKQRMSNIDNLIGFDECFIIALRVWEGFGGDPSNGATHYHTKYIDPEWNNDMVETARIGVHIFYKYKDE